MSLCNYGCTALSDQDLVLCNEYKKGGISAWAWINCGFTFTDITSQAEWTSGIAAGDIKVFKNVSAEIPYESPDFIESPVACQEDYRAGATHTAVITDANVTPTNALNYPKLNTAKGYPVFFSCEDNILYYQLDKLARFDSKLQVPKSNKELAMFQIDVAWRNAELLIADAPDGIFDE